MFKKNMICCLVAIWLSGESSASGLTILIDFSSQETRATTYQSPLDGPVQAWLSGKSPIPGFTVLSPIKFPSIKTIMFQFPLDRSVEECTKECSKPPIRSMQDSRHYQIDLPEPLRVNLAAFHNEQKNRRYFENDCVVHSLSRIWIDQFGKLVIPHHTLSVIIGIIWYHICVTSDKPPLWDMFKKTHPWFQAIINSSTKEPVARDLYGPFLCYREWLFGSEPVEEEDEISPALPYGSPIIPGKLVLLSR
ncbi:MAG: hypothetical protein LBT03_01090 [Holosporales bacterium]|jgi:hypothetical protein|nr:hypothetical protein [Holosporales bacterium]